MQLKNELYRGVFEPFEDMGQACRYGAFVVTEEVNGFGLWRFDNVNYVSFVEMFHGFKGSSDAIERAVMLTQRAKAKRA